MIYQLPYHCIDLVQASCKISCVPFACDYHLPYRCIDVLQVLGNSTLGACVLVADCSFRIELARRSRDSSKEAGDTSHAGAGSGEKRSADAAEL